MRPIAINGHERPITKVKFNRDGDLLFTSAKNPVANVWFADDGERLGCFGHVKKGDNDPIASFGHTGAIFDIDVSEDSKRFITASADEMCILWDCENGKIINKIKAGNVLRSCGFSKCGNLIYYTTHPSIIKTSYLRVLDTRCKDNVEGEASVSKYSSDLEVKGSISKAEFGPLDETIIIGYEKGYVDSIDALTGEVVKSCKPHAKIITDIQMFKDKSMFITSSKDHAAKLFDSFNLDEFITYTTERPVNSASISPYQKHVILAGGQEAEDVTTSASSGKFDSRLYHMVYGEEFGNIKGHFGPVNSVQFNPEGTGFVSGGEDGYVRIHIFDPDYYEIDNKIF